MVTGDGTTDNNPMFYCECYAGYVGYLCEGEYNLLLALITERMYPVHRGVLFITNNYNIYFVERHIQSYSQCFTLNSMNWFNKNLPNLTK